MTSVSDKGNGGKAEAERAGVRDGVWVLGTRIAGILLGLPVGILNAWILGPAILGSLRIIQTLGTLALGADLGLTKAYQRELPILEGSREAGRSSRMSNLVLTESLIVTLAVIALLWIAFSMGITYGGVFSSARVLALLSALFLCQRVAAFLTKRLSGHGRFVLQSRIELVMAVFRPLVVAGGVVLYGLEGVLAAMVLAGLVYIAVVVRVDPQRFSFVVDLKETRRLLHIGASLFVLNLGNKVFWSLELLLIPVILDLEDAGLYAFAFGLLTTAGSIPTSLHRIFWRNLSLERGEEGLSDTGYMRPYLGLPVALFSLLGAWCVGTGYLAYRALVGTVLPEFAESLPLMLIVAGGWIVGQQRTFASIVLNLNDRFKTLIALQLALVGVNVVADLILISQFGLVGAAIGTAFGFVSSGIVHIVAANIALFGWPGARRLGVTLRVVGAASLSVTFLHFAPPAVLGWISGTDSPQWWVELAGIAVLGTVYTAWVMVVYGVLFRRYGLTAEVGVRLGEVSDWLVSNVRRAS